MLFAIEGRNPNMRSPAASIRSGEVLRNERFKYSLNLQSVWIMKRLLSAHSSVH